VPVSTIYANIYARPLIWKISFSTIVRLHLE
jgi:hypothetical protein